MSDLAIRVDALSKRYRLGQTVDLKRTFVETLATLPRFFGSRARQALRRAAGGGDAVPADEFWALRDVSFQVRHGETLGVIGRNGAGKSTLLKILTRITEPTGGRAELRGRVASLLEVGTGFHPELSGRENIYLNGAILGMTRREIRARFDEIVAFAEVERFLDTPVKRYSSGMYVRLAFAVAAHLEPEVLLVDEVLAVGDAAFQRKCLGKMQDVAGGGRTVLFVSHNMAAVRGLCGRALWLHEGRLAGDGPAAETIDAYLSHMPRAERVEELPARIAALPPDPVFRLLDARVEQRGRPTTTVGNGEPVRVVFRYEVRATVRGLRVYFDLRDEQQTILIRSFHDEHAAAVEPVAPGEYESIAEIPANLLAPREYELVLRAGIHNVRTLIPDGLCLPLRVEPTRALNRAYPDDVLRSLLQPEIAWTTRRRTGP